MNLSKLIVIFLIFSSFATLSLAIMPEPTPIDASYWEKTQHTGLQLDYFNTTETNLGNGKSRVCLIPLIEMSKNDPLWKDNSVKYRKQGELQGTIEPSDFELETEGGKIKKGCIDIDSSLGDYYHIGSNSIIYIFQNMTWLMYNTTTYEKEGFTIDVYCNGQQLDTYWYEVAGTKKFWWDNSSAPYTNCEIEVHDDENILTFDSKKGVIHQKIIYENYFDWGSGKIQTRHYNNPLYLDVSDLINASENNITSATIEEHLNSESLEGWNRCLDSEWYKYFSCLNDAYKFNIKIEGSIINTDPELKELFSSTTDTLSWQTNRTEVTDLGLRIDAPVLFMNFNQNAEGTYVKDNSIYNNFGTTSGSPTYNSSCVGRTFANDGCWEFDGVNDYIEISDEDSLDFGAGSEFSISFWAKTSDTDTRIQKYDAVSTNGYAFFFSAAGISFTTWSSGTAKSVSPTIDLIDNSWHMVTVTRSSTGNISIYNDGIFDNSIDEGGRDLTNSGNLFLGTSYLEDDDFFNGSIDQVQIWDRALSSIEIQELYNGTVYNNSDYIGKYSRAGDFKSLVFYNLTSTYWNTTLSLADSDYQDTLDYVNSTGLVSYWRLDQSFEDSVGGNDGTNSGSSDTVGIVKHGRKFDGSDDVINVGSDSGLDDMSPLTYSAWIKPNSDGENNGGRILDKGGNTIFYVRDIDLNNNIQLAFFVNYDGASDCYASTTYNLSITEWAHVAVEWDGSNTESSINFYVNGELRTGHRANADGVGSRVSDASGNMGIGNKVSDTSRTFDGSIDEVLIFNRSLSPTEIQEIYDEQSKYYGVNISDPNLVSYWTLDESYDDLVGSNDGTPTGTNNATGISSGAMRFDGSSYIDMGDKTDFEDNTQMTISAWVKTSGTAYHFVSKGDTDDYEFALSNNGDGYAQVIAWETAGAGYFIARDTISMADGEWHHILGTIENGVEANIYVDGVLKDTDSTPSGTWNVNGVGNVYIGGREDLGADMVGEIDEVLIYNDSLTASEIQQLYKAGLSQHANTNITLETRTADSYNNSDSDLMVLYAFNNNYNDSSTNKLHTGKYVLDASGNGAEITFVEDGVIGSAGYFNGTTCLVTNDSVVFDVTGESYAIALWIRPDALSYNGEIINAYSDNWGLKQTTGSVYVFDSRSSEQTLSTSYTPTDRWTHLAVTRGGASDDVWWYINGVMVEADTGAGTFLSPNSLMIGCQLDNKWKGYMDELRIYDKNLTADEVLSLYNLGQAHISDWTDWESQGKVEDGIPVYTDTNATFYQFRPIYETDNTDVSAYVLNYTVEEVDPIPVVCTPVWVNGTWTDYINITDCQINDSITMSSNITQYDSNFCGTGNTTYYNYSNVSCDYCSFDVINLTHIDSNSSCQINDSITNTINWTEYDQNYSICYGVTGIASDLWNSGNNNSYENVTNVSSCNYCSYDLVNSSATLFDISSCQLNDSINQHLNWTEYDQNYSSCYAVTGQDTDLWNSGINITHKNDTFINCSDYPNCTLTAPPDNYNMSNTTFMIFNFTGSDGNQLKNSSLYINGILNQTNITNLVNGSYSFNLTLSQVNGSLNWSGEVCDIVNNCNHTENFTLITHYQDEKLDYSPNVTLLQPSDNYNMSNTSLMVFNCSATDETGLDTVQLWINGTVNQSNTTGLINGTYNFDLTMPQTNGTFLWSCRANDTSGNINHTDNFTLIQHYQLGCIESLVNTTPITYNITNCQINDSINQKTNWTQYDSSYCGITPNETFFNYSSLGCNYCSYDLQITDYTEFENITSCQANDTITQDSTATQFDNNYENCCAITGIGNDCTYETNTTLHNYSHISCGYACTLEIVYPLNTNYLVNVTSLTYEVYDYSGISHCWWNNGTINSTPDTGCANFTSITSSSATWYVYANDTLGTMCSDSVVFTVGAVTTTTKTCRYKKLGYYNLRKPFMKEANCI